MALREQEDERLPATLKRSSKKAQATYIHTLEAAEGAHGDGEAAHRIAFGSLKHSLEKGGDHWEPKDEKGPSDDQDAKRGPNERPSFRA
jgi:ChaB